MPLRPVCTQLPTTLQRGGLIPPSLRVNLSVGSCVAPSEERRPTVATRRYATRHSAPRTPLSVPPHAVLSAVAAGPSHRAVLTLGPPMAHLYLPHPTPTSFRLLFRRHLLCEGALQPLSDPPSQPLSTLVLPLFRSHLSPMCHIWAPYLVVSPTRRRQGRSQRFRQAFSLCTKIPSGLTQGF